MDRRDVIASDAPSVTVLRTDVTPDYELAVADHVHTQDRAALYRVLLAFGIPEVTAVGTLNTPSNVACRPTLSEPASTGPAATGC
jgi:hypothetical protein